MEFEERADLVVGELIGSLGLDGDIITIFCDASKLPQTGRAPATGWPRSRRRPIDGSSGENVFFPTSDSIAAPEIGSS